MKKKHAAWHAERAKEEEARRRGERPLGPRGVFELAQHAVQGVQGRGGAVQALRGQTAKAIHQIGQLGGVYVVRGDARSPAPQTKKKHES